MSAICFYFQVHQPFRLKSQTFKQVSSTHNYFDNAKNSQVFKKVADKCYLPTNHKLLELIKRHQGKFKVAFSISGVAIDQMRLYAPEVLRSFQDLANTGCVEFLGETYYHSLASVYDLQEFKEQIFLHDKLMQECFNQKPKVFRNTELIYNDQIGQFVSSLGYKGMICEGADDILAWRSPNFVYSVPQTQTKLLMKNYRLSDDIAFRFSDKGWKEFPLTADKFANWVHQISGSGDIVNLFMDYETFGEHQWACTGIFEFLDYLPSMIMNHPDWSFQTPSEVIKNFSSVAEMSVGRLTSWADVGRDLTAWQGNRMQLSSLEEIYNLGKYLKMMGDKEALHIWRKLLTSDHYYYMCTKWFADGDVHAYFSPYESPYEAFMAFKNAFRDFKEGLVKEALKKVASLEETTYSNYNLLTELSTPEH